MTPACQQLFEFSLKEITRQDIVDFCPGDPGYGAYVAKYTKIHFTRTLPKESDFDLWETINLTNGLDLALFPNPDRFRRFQVFIHLVGVALMLGPQQPSDSAPLNYYAINLLRHLHALKDKRALKLLPRVFRDLSQRCVHFPEVQPELPFILLGRLLLALMGHDSSEDRSDLIARIIREGEKNEPCSSAEFLWGWTYFDRFHDEWRRLVRLSFPKRGDDEGMTTLRDLLVPSDRV